MFCVKNCTHFLSNVPKVSLYDMTEFVFDKEECCFDKETLTVTKPHSIFWKTIERWRINSFSRFNGRISNLRQDLRMRHHTGKDIK